jgi:high-affinity Fe2+/Pb2+ permease
MSTRQQRLVRTIVLGAIAVAAAIAWLAVELGMDPHVLAHYAWTSLLLVLAVIALAVAGAGLLRLVRWLTGRR